MSARHSAVTTVDRDVIDWASTLFRFGRLLSLVLWIGGICFFAFVMAPVAFGRLATAHDAGLVVGGALRVLHVLGLTCGGVFLVLTLMAARWRITRRALLLEVGLTVVMVLGTAYSQFKILPEMEGYRVKAGGEVALAEATSVPRIQFERLHRLSERVEGAVLFVGLALLLAVSSEGQRVRTIES